MPRYPEIETKEFSMGDYDRRMKWNGETGPVDLSLIEYIFPGVVIRRPVKEFNGILIPEDRPDEHILNPLEFELLHDIGDFIKPLEEEEQSGRRVAAVRTTHFFEKTKMAEVLSNRGMPCGVVVYKSGYYNAVRGNLERELRTRNPNIVPGEIWRELVGSFLLMDKAPLSERKPPILKVPFPIEIGDLV